MPTCKKCSTPFPARLKIEGKYRGLDKRSFCLDCSLFGGRNTKDLTQVTDSSERACPRCQLTLTLDHFYLNNKRNRPSSYCRQCTAEECQERLWATKQQAIEYKGGQCNQCGYDRCPAALDFHHLDPAQKEFSIARFKSRSFDNLKDELDKCVLLCANCHRELHSTRPEHVIPQRCSSCGEAHSKPLLFRKVLLCRRCRATARQQVREVRPSHLDPDWRRKQHPDRRRVDYREVAEHYNNTKNYCATARHFKISDQMVRKIVAKLATSP